MKSLAEPFVSPSSRMQHKLGIIAGGGTLPRSLVHHCLETGRAYCLIALVGHAEILHLKGIECLHWSRIGAAGKIIDILKDEEVGDLVMVGPVKRPSLMAAMPDIRGLKFLLRAGRSAFGGDNSILSAIAGELEAEGFRVVGIDSLLKGLLTPPGVLTFTTPTNDVNNLIQVGLEEARKLGSQDIGQAVVIEGTNILAREARGGTDDLIRRASGLARNKRNLILVKAKKPGQDRRVDLPTVGLETVQLAAEHGFSGIAIEAGHSLLVDKERAIAAADAANLFIIGI